MSDIGDERFSSARLKIGRAKSLADDLDAEIAAFRKTEPVTVDGEGVVLTINGGTGARTFTVRGVDPLPDLVPLLAGDAAHNIRSALDHFAVAAVTTPGRATCFPVWSRDNPSKTVPTPREWQDTVEKQLEGASPELIDAVKAMSPWVTGNDERLWAIHELDRIDKHRLLISVAMANTATVFNTYPVVNPEPGKPPPAVPLAIATPRWTPLEAGTVLYEAPEGRAPEPDPIGFQYDVALVEPANLRGQPVVTQLRMLAHQAEATMMRLALVA